MSLPPRLPRDAIKPKPRVRSQAHRDWVRSHQCCVPGCLNMPIEVAHINRAAFRGMGQKASDAFTVSLCKAHHGSAHALGEKTLENDHGIDLMALAKTFYFRSPYRNRLDNPYGG